MLLTDTELLRSEVAANAAMNRGRGLSGVNSYERELRLPLAAFLRERAETRGEAVWFDACCGEGRALAEARTVWDAEPWGARVHILGVDLVDLFAVPEAPGLRLVAADVVTFAPDRPADLITSVHGLHYLGDKLGFLENAYSHLRPGGLLLASFDPANVRSAQDNGASSLWPRLARRVRAQGIALRLENHLLRIERAAADTDTLDFGALAYQGATVSERPNYSGMTVVDSWYALTP